MATSVNIRYTLGAVQAGGLASMVLSGVVAVQSFLYYRMYPRDAISIKRMVALIWLLDAAHSTLIVVAIWRYFVLSFGDSRQDDVIYEEIALSVCLTAIITFAVHMFFAARVYRLSQENWLITAPILVLSLARLGCAIATTIEMSELRSYSRFVSEMGWVFTLGLSFSSATDIVIVATMCFFLHTSRTGLGKMDHVIDILSIYTFNNGALTCLVTIATLICWITMNNLVFLGIHFCIAKLYAISLLITLNTRRSIRRRAEPSDHEWDLDIPMPLPSIFARHTTRTVSTHLTSSIRQDSNGTPRTQILINIDKTIQLDVHVENAEDLAEQAHEPSPVTPTKQGSEQGDSAL